MFGPSSGLSCTALELLDLGRGGGVFTKLSKLYVYVIIKVSCVSIVGTVLSGLNREVVSLGRSIVIAL